MALLLLLLSVPLIEIALFVVVGGAIGLGATLLIVVLTALIGAAMLRRQSVAALGALQAAMDRGEDPAGPLADGALLLIGAFCLLIPGFFTDALGLALLFPAVRGALVGRLRPAMTARAARTRRAHPADEAPIEAEYRDVTEPETGPARPLPDDRRPPR